MITSLRLDDTLEKILQNLSTKLAKKKSEIIRDAIVTYNDVINNQSSNRIKKAVSKTKNADKKIYDDMEMTLNDGIQG
jgi:predicted DNA-binding protein